MSIYKFSSRIIVIYTATLSTLTVMKGNGVGVHSYLIIIVALILQEMGSYKSNLAPASAVAPEVLRRGALLETNKQTNRYCERWTRNRQTLSDGDFGHP